MGKHHMDKKQATYSLTAYQASESPQGISDYNCAISYVIKHSSKAEYASYCEADEV
jgi:hypothetical protein